MDQPIRKVLPGRVVPYLQVLVALLIVAVAIYAVMLISGCGESTSPSPPLTSSDMSGQTGGHFDQPPPLWPDIYATSPSAYPGQTASRSLSGGGSPDAQPGDAASLQASQTVTLTWTPPPGATNFSFDRSPEQGGPPFVWRAILSSVAIHVQYSMPNLPAGRAQMTLVETLQSQSGGQSSAASFATLLSAQAAPAPAPGLTLPQLVPLDRLADAPTWWSVGRFLDPKGVALSTRLCQDWTNRMQSDKVFLAMRLPLSPTTTMTVSHPVPVVFPGVYSNTLRMGRYDLPAPAITVPVELRPERFTFLANALPPAVGEMWVALGLVSDPVTCPAGLAAPANSWGYLLQTHLDLTQQPDNCQGCTLPIYYCYEGQQEPLLATVAGSLLGAEVTSYQGSGVTCIGPQPLQLGAPGSRWSLGGQSRVMITQTQVISIMHFINALDPITISLSYNSPLNVQWNVYGGTQVKPNLTDPITRPFSVQGPKFFWLISNPVPPSVADGPYTLIVTATSVMTPTDSHWKGDMIWVGDWVAPPPGLPTLTPTRAPTYTATATITRTPTVTRTPTRTPTHRPPGSYRIRLPVILCSAGG